jgi:predicted lipid-binding transport protein (Tim44 family)
MMMIRNIRLLAMLAALLVTTFLAVEQNAQARVGGGGSMGSRGTRSYSRPVAPPSQMSPSRPYAPSQPSPLTSPYQQPSRGLFGGGFGGSFLGSMAGGMLGGMLFRSMGFGGGYGGGMGGSGIGLFEILLLAGIGYMIYRFVKKNRADESGYNGGYNQPGKVIQLNDYQSQNPGVGYAPARDELEEGLSYIRQMDPGFDEKRFNDNVMDMFFRIQGAFMNRDLSSASGLLTDELRGLLQRDVDTLLRDKKVNRLENIAVRSVEISEAWQESGKDFVTAMIYANLLDYTTDDTTGAVLSGSKTEPVKFEEYWTFTRPVGNNPWKLSAINQK